MSPPEPVRETTRAPDGRARENSGGRSSARRSTRAGRSGKRRPHQHGGNVDPRTGGTSDVYLPHALESGHFVEPDGVE